VNAKASIYLFAYITKHNIISRRNVIMSNQKRMVRNFQGPEMIAPKFLDRHFLRWRQQTESRYAVHNCKSENRFFDRFRLPRHVPCGSVKKPGWAVVYWLISKRSTVPRSALVCSKMADANPNSPRMYWPIRVLKHFVVPQRIAPPSFYF